MLDLSRFTFTAEQVRDINELVFDEILHAPDLNYIHTLFPGIVYDKEVGFITGGGLVGKAGQGCDPEPQDFSIGTRRVLWQPKSWEVFLKQCASDLETTAVVYSQNNHTRVDDLTDTDFMTIVVKVLTESVRDALYRIVWFSDTDAKNYASGGDGIITAGVDTEYFTIIDGLFKQLQAAVAAHSGLGVTIEANSKSTAAEQLSALDGDAAFALLKDMYYKAPIELRQSGDMRFIVTQSVADAYQQYLIGKGIESTYRNLTEGISALKFLGVDVVPMPIWDKMIQSYNNLGDTFYKPHRALLVEKANLAVGTPAEEAYGEFDIWYDKTSRNNYILIKDKIDAKLLDDTRLVYAQ